MTFCFIIAKSDGPFAGVLWHLTSQVVRDNVLDVSQHQPLLISITPLSCVFRAAQIPPQPPSLVELQGAPMSPRPLYPSVTLVLQVLRKVIIYSVHISWKLHSSPPFRRMLVDIEMQMKSEQFILPFTASSVSSHSSVLWRPGVWAVLALYG